MAKILLLPGSKWQLILAEKIKKMGHILYVVSPEDKSPCLEIANEFFKSDIFAVDNIEKYAKEQKIEAIISDECDIAMPVVAELGRRLGLSTLSTDAAALYTNKFLMRKFCDENGLKTLEHRLCKNVDDAVEFLEELGHSIIIKPLDSNASHGVYRADTEEDVRNHFDEAMSFSRIGKAVLAERFILGTEFTVDGIKTPTQHYTLAISEKKHFKHNSSIANELYFTHYNHKFDYDLLRKTNDAFVMASPLEYGFTHAEYKFENGEYYMIEIGARGGGNMISSIITQYMSGYDTYKYLVNSALGYDLDSTFDIDNIYRDRAAVLKFFSTPSGCGKVVCINGLDYLESESRIVEFQLNFDVGDIIEDAKNDSARIGFYICCARTKSELDEIIDKVEHSFSITVE